MNKDGASPLATFFFEMRQLREAPRSGWQLIGASGEESVAEHSLRAAQIGFALAILEGYDNPEEVAAMLVFHDMAEARVGDIHKVADRYIEHVREQDVVTEQTTPLGVVGEGIRALWLKAEERKEKGGVIAKDADRLEVAFTARELEIRGYAKASDWIKNVGPLLRTDSAKQLWDELQRADPDAWWQGLKHIS
jgi:putative hydrolase of HD superfamily